MVFEGVHVYTCVYAHRLSRYGCERDGGYGRACLGVQWACIAFRFAFRFVFRFGSIEEPTFSSRICSYSEEEEEKAETNGDDERRWQDADDSGRAEGEEDREGSLAEERAANAERETAVHSVSVIQICVCTYKRATIIRANIYV